MSDRWARKRLNRLVDAGLVEREGKGFASWNLSKKGKDELE
jgi:predicted transcriptional regulator